LKRPFVLLCSATWILGACNSIAGIDGYASGSLAQDAGDAASMSDVAQPLDGAQLPDSSGDCALLTIESTRTDLKIEVDGRERDVTGGVCVVLGANVRIRCSSSMRIEPQCPGLSKEDECTFSMPTTEVMLTIR
jgi:hypothetical protein